MAIRKVYFSNSGVPATGLTLAWNKLVKVSDGTNFTQPTFTEVGGGWYKFTINPTEPLVGVVDGSGTLANANERYVPVYFDPADYLFDARVVPIYNANSDALVFAAFLLVNGTLATNASLTNCSLTIYDSNNNALFTVSSVSPTNSTFIITKSSPGLSSNALYYVVATITYGGTTYQTIDVFFSLQ